MMRLRRAHPAAGALLTHLGRDGPRRERVLPMQLQMGARLTDETGEWEVIGRPYTSAQGRTRMFA